MTIFSSYIHQVKSVEISKSRDNGGYFSTNIVIHTKHGDFEFVLFRDNSPPPVTQEPA